MDNTELSQALKIVFASEYAFFLKAQFCHWNVEGSAFVQLHELFGDIYNEVYSSIDDFAENIRKIGSYTPASFERFSMLSKIDDAVEIITADQMIQELLVDSEKMSKLIAVVYQVSENYGEIGLSNFLAARQDAHQKHSWKLRSILK